MRAIWESVCRIQWRRNRMKVSMVRRKRDGGEHVSFKTGKTRVIWFIPVPGIQ